MDGAKGDMEWIGFGTGEGDHVFLLLNPERPNPRRGALQPREIVEKSRFRKEKKKRQRPALWQRKYLNGEGAQLGRKLKWEGEKESG